MKKLLKVIDFISDESGKTASWLTSFLVVLISYEIIRRYVFNAPTEWNFETSLMIGATMVAFGWAYAHRYNQHIRIDILYSRLSSRIKAGIDVFGALFFFLPLIFIFVKTSIVLAIEAWTSGEKSILTQWYPPLAPFRTVVAIAFTLLAMQGIAQFIRDLSLLMRKRRYE